MSRRSATQADGGCRGSMRIVSASRRTDIPAFYSEWFMRRVRAGFCHWINPFGGHVYRVSLLPADVLAMVFWTRSPQPLLRYLPELRDAGHHFYFHITVNGYPQSLESNNPSLEGSVKGFERLSEFLPPDLAHWRYDPIVISDITPLDYHLRRFDEISRRLEGLTRRCYFSFVDMYGKTERNLRNVALEHGIAFESPDVTTQRHLVHQLRDIAASRGITLYACCESQLVGEGVAESHCIDLDTIRELRSDADIHLKAAPTRADCGCVETSDIGAYDTCIFGCAYCYATNSRKASLARMHSHDPSDTVLWRPASLAGVDLTTREFVSKKSGFLSDDGIPVQPKLM